MKLLTTVAAGLMLALGLVVSGPVEAPAQLEDEGLAIYGTVMVPGTREPVSGAEVLLAGPDRTFLERMQRGKEVRSTADAEGRFVFSGLAPGEYEIRPVYPDAENLGSRVRNVRLTESGLPLDIELWMSPRARVSGRVFGPGGEPMQDVSVRLLVLGWNKRPALIQPPDETPGLTDEDGRYEVRVPPGEYYLTAAPRPATVYPPHFYPGVLYPEDAARITVQPGSDLAGIDVSLGNTEVYSVRFDFVVPPPPGVPEPLSAFLEEGQLPLDAFIGGLGRGPETVRLRPSSQARLERIDEDTWLIDQPLAPGEYQLLLVYSPQLRDALEEFGLDWSIVNDLAITRFSLDADDVDDESSLDLGMIPESPKVPVTGRVVVRSAEPGSLDRSGLRIYAGLEDTGAGRFAVPNPDGMFLMERLLPGVWTFGVDPLPEGWSVESMRSGGFDVLRDGLEVGGQVSPVEIVIADDHAGIRGTTRNAAGDLLPYGRVVLVPPVQQRGPAMRFPYVVGDSAGAYELEGVPPGEYRLLALDEAGTVVVDPFSPHFYWESPEFLREYELRGELITVDPGANMTINLEAIQYVQ